LTESLPAFVTILRLDGIENDSKAFAFGKDHPKFLNTYVFEKLVPHCSVILFIENSNIKLVVIVLTLNLWMVDWENDELECVFIHVNMVR